MSELPTIIQRQVLELIEGVRADLGYAPTVRELAQLLGVASTHTVAGHLAALEARGLLTRVPNSARTLAATEAGKKLLAIPEDELARLIRMERASRRVA